MLSNLNILSPSPSPLHPPPPQPPPPPRSDTRSPMTISPSPGPTTRSLPLTGQEKPPTSGLTTRRPLWAGSGTEVEVGGGGGLVEGRGWNVVFVFVVVFKRNNVLPSHSPTLNPTDPNPAISARVVFPQSGHIRPEKQPFFQKFPHFSKIEPYKKYEPLIGSNTRKIT